MKKKALISSILTIAVCVSLIAGATFALFTSESQVNVAVTAGKVDVQAMILNDTMQLFSALADPTADPNAEGTLIDENGATYIYKDRTKEATFTNGGTATIVGNTLNLDKVTPGDKVTFNIKITNRSNIAVQYRVRVACTYGADLFYGLNFKVNDTDFSKVLSHTSAWKPLEAVENGEKEIDNVTVSVDLPIDAGNRYQDKTCKIVYVVEAVQGNAATSPAPDDEVMSVQWQDLAYGVSVPAAVNGVITIYDEVELAAFAASVNAGNTYKGITVALADDMDLGGAYWTPIGLNGDTATTLFQGTFDGQGHTISNMVVDTLNQNAAVFATRAVVGSYTAAGFFGSLNGTAKNIIFEDASVNHISTGDQTVNGIAVVAGSIYSRGAIDNVHVNNATVAGNRYVGGIAGYVYGSITNCSVTNATLTATPNAVAADKYDNGDKVGGIAGYFRSASVYVISENAVRNVDIFAYRDAGSIVGAGDAGTAVVANEAKNVNIKIDQETYHYGNKDVNAGEIIGRVMSGTVDPTNKAVSVEIVGCATVNGKVYGSLSQVLEEETVGDVTINVPESTTISWKTGAEHGSTPWGAETVGNITVVGAEDGTSKFVATGSGVGPIAHNNEKCSITFKNITIVDESVSYAENSWEYGYLEFDGKVVFENCVFVNAVMVSGDTEFKKCEFNSNNANEYDVWVDGGEASFTDCLFEGYRGLKMHEAYGSNITSVTVDDCEFNELSKKPGVAIGTLNAGTTVVIKNSSFINCMPGDQQLFIYETDTDVTTLNFTNENNTVQLTVDNESLEDALTANLEHIVVNLTSDVTYDVNAWKADAMGGAITKTVTINGNDHTITFNHTNSDWNHIVTNGAKLIINNANITNSGYNNGPWNRHDISFACEVELNNVTSDKALAFKAGATLNTVTINDANTSDTYAIWIQPNGQTVSIDTLTVDMKDCTDGRGIKIDNQYNENSEQKVTLIVKNATFHTEEKAAIIVKSAVGADIQLENVNIADTIDPAHEVWVDEDSKEYYDLVTVKGGTKICEANVVANATELKAAVAAGITDLYLLPGEYDVYGCSGKTLTINGTKDVVLKVMNEGEDGCDGGFDSAIVTFNGVTIDTTANNGNYKGYTRLTATFNDCKFFGAYTSHMVQTFNNCEFDFNNGYFWTWGATAVTFNECVFSGTSKAILAHGWASQEITLNKCTFAATEKGYASSGTIWTSAIEIDPAGTNTYTIEIKDCKINENYAGWARIKDASTGHSIKIDGAYLVLDETMFKAAINSGEEEIEIILAKDISVDIGTGWKMGTEATKSISIKGITDTVTLNLSNTYRSYFNMANPDGKLYLSDLVLTNAHAGTHFFDYTTHFNCDLVAENVTFAKSPLVDSGVTAQFTDCNFSQAGTDIYGLWIMSGSNVTVIGGELTTDRGFKIADEDSAKELTKLTVSGTKFNNSKKAAILVTTAYGAEITLNGLDITNCGADSTNAVWIDDGRTANEDTVVVTGGTVIIEP